MSTTPTTTTPAGEVRDYYGITFGGDEFTALAEAVLICLTAPGVGLTYIELTVRDDDDTTYVAEGLLTGYSTDAAWLSPMGDDGMPVPGAPQTRVPASDVIHVNIP